MKKTLLLSSLLSANVLAGQVEVLHWWSSPGEEKAVQVLKNKLKQQGHQWQDFAVIGGGGESAITVLQTRAVSGNPPASAQIKGPDIQEWAKLGFLANLEPMAKAHNWSQVLPHEIAAAMQYKQQYVAVPINIHRVNWLWINKKIFDELELDPPTSWQTFFEAADKIKAAGYIPLVHGRKSWQDAVLFESVALSIMGADKYKRAFVDHDKDLLNSELLVQVFEQFKRLRPYIDKDAGGRDWNHATRLLASNRAAMQLMGDWAKGELTALNKKPGIDYLCLPAPGTAGNFSYNVDSFILFKQQRSLADTETQNSLALAIMDKGLQKEFSLVKGSIPARNDINLSQFDACAIKSAQDFSQDKLVPSIAQNMANTSFVQSAMADVISHFFNNPNADAKDAAHKLAIAIRAAS